MSKELEAFDILLQHIETEADWNDYEKVKNAHKIVEQALQRLESIDNAKPSEALERFDYIGNDIIFAYDDDFVSYDYTDDVEYIKQALLKAQEQEKDKVFLKNIGNTKVKVPLVDIFNGLSREKRFAYTEHIYYHWEEMKESLEAEIKNIKTEKENLESKAKKQEKVLKIIFKKEVSIFQLKCCKNVNEYNDLQFKKDKKLTDEEFKLLKRYCDEQDN